MKALRRILACTLALLFMAAPALAFPAATPNQRLAFRTGPNTKYVELYTLPESTALTAIEYESGNGVTWVLVEYVYESQVNRAYTGLKRMTVHGEIPWAAHLNQPVSLMAGTTVLAAPSGQGAYRGWIDPGTQVKLLRWDGSYAFIEFEDSVHGAPSRGWVPASAVGGDAQGSTVPGSQSGFWAGGFQSGASSGESRAAGLPGCVNQPETESSFWNRYPDYRSFTGGRIRDGELSVDSTMATRLASAGTVRCRVVTDTAFVPMFAEADTSSDRLAKLYPGRTVDALGQWRGWVLCIWGTTVDNVLCGWVEAAALREI